MPRIIYRRAPVNDWADYETVDITDEVRSAVVEYGASLKQVTQLRPKTEASPEAKKRKGKK